MLVALSGLAGAGKTTSIDILERLGVGASVYVGSFVTSEVIRRGLPATPASEKQVRQYLRDEHGMHVLARLALPTIEGILAAGRTALVDAIYNEEERNLYESELGDHLVCIAVEASFSKRAERLATRPGRSLTPRELEIRDQYELDHLGIGAVIEKSHKRLNNNGSLHDLEETLKLLACDLVP